MSDLKLQKRPLGAKEGAEEHSAMEFTKHTNKYCKLNKVHCSLYQHKNTKKKVYNTLHSLQKQKLKRALMFAFPSMS